MRKSKVLAVASTVIVAFATVSFVFLLRSVPSTTPLISAKTDPEFFPTRYAVLIIPDIERLTFEANITIHFEPKNSKRILVLDSAKTLEFPKELQQFFDKKTETIAINVPAKSKYISFSYKGAISKDFYGLYQTNDTTTGTIGLATQFEPNYARRVIPCVDSPKARAVFAISVFAPDGYIALSNNDVVSKQTYKGGTIYNFGDTPPMPSYLVAICVGKWDVLKGKTKRGVRVNIYTLPGKSQRAKFALKMAADTIDFFEEYTGVKYAMDILQYAAIPDFAAAAMENYGIVTCRDFLVDSDENTSIVALSRIAEVIAHENAHMWVGNLVSPLSWDFTWLNEGFATILPHIALENVKGDYYPWSELYHDVTQRAINFDINSHSHPIMMPGADAEMMFDDITYRKGATLLNMLRLFLTPEVFRKCLGKYLETYAFTSTTTKDLISSFENTSNMKISNFIKIWTEEKGFPTLFVSKNKEGKMEIEQMKVALNGEKSCNIVWPISLFFSNGNSILMETKHLTVDSFSYINPGRKGMMIVSYSDEIIEEMRINWKNLSNDVKWVFLEDLQRLVLCKIKSPLLLMTFLKLCTNEIDPCVIFSTSHLANFVLEITHDQKTIDEVSSIIMHYITIKKSKAMTLMEFDTRSSLVLIAGHICGTKKLIEMLKKENTHIDDNSDFSDMFYLSWTEEGFGKIIEKCKSSKDTRFILEAQKSLGSTRNPENVAKIVDMFGKAIKWQNAVTVMNSLTTNPATRNTMHKYFLKEMKKLYSVYGVGFQMERVIESAYKSAQTLEELGSLDKTIRESVIPVLWVTCDRYHEYSSSRIAASKKLASLT